MWSPLPIGEPIPRSPTVEPYRLVRTPMATENVAILFTDIVGSTALSQRLSPEVADEVRRGHFSILRQAIAETGGTEVKNLGDGLMVVFSSASAALACAVAMQQGVEQKNRAREHLVGLRIGLSGGEVSREDDDYFGDPVVEAARLCATCESGQVLAADIVRLTAGRRSTQNLSFTWRVDLKGTARPGRGGRSALGAPRCSCYRYVHPAAESSRRSAHGGCGRARDRDGVAGGRHQAGGRGRRRGGAARLG